MIYDVDYFLNKFEAIPESLWCVCDVGSHGGPRCANGHTYLGNQKTDESSGLYKIFLSLKITPNLQSNNSERKTEESFANYIQWPCDNYSRVAEQINNGNTNEYKQATPKQRILAALYDIKKIQEEQLGKAKEPRVNVIYVAQTLKESVPVLNYNKNNQMEKKLYYSLDANGEGGIMELSGCLEWIRGDMESNYPESAKMTDEELPEYILTPVWMTDAEYEALPDQ